MLIRSRTGYAWNDAIFMPSAIQCHLIQHSTVRHVRSFDFDFDSSILVDTLLSLPNGLADRRALSTLPLCSLYFTLTPYSLLYTASTLPPFPSVYFILIHCFSCISRSYGFV